METLASQFEEEGNISIFPEVEKFWQTCSDEAKQKVVSFIQNIRSKTNENEILCVMQWIELQAHRSSIVFYVMNRLVLGEDRYRFMISFHAPEYRFCSAASTFRTCVVRDEKWRSLAESLTRTCH